MKKYIIGSLAIATMAIAGWNFNQKSEVQLTDLALDNVEALASGETTTPTNCPGGVVLCAWIQDPWGGSVTYYKK